MSPRAVGAPGLSHDELIVGTVRIALTVFWISVGLFALYTSVGEQPQLPDARTKQALLAVFPQGWAFFTRSPREPEDRVFQLQNQRWISLEVRNAEPRLLFGLVKQTRIMGMELGALLSAVPPQRWIDCAPAQANCWRSVRVSPTRLINRMPAQSLCGHLLVQRRAPIPWAWLKNRERVRMPASFTEMDVTCAPPQAGMSPVSVVWTSTHLHGR